MCVIVTLLVIIMSQQSCPVGVQDVIHTSSDHPKLMNYAWHHETSDNTHFVWLCNLGYGSPITCP